jgi:hypothetical protein
MVAIKRLSSVTVAAFVACGLLSSESRGALSVDGNLSDWGVTLVGGHLLFDGFSNNSRGVYARDGVAIFYQTEDQADDAGDTGPLGPNHGGQNYDAEFLGLTIYSGRLYIAISSGQRPDNLGPDGTTGPEGGIKRFAPGDIRIVTSQYTYGVEVGGGAGGAGFDSLIDEEDPGSTYELTSHGFTSAVLSSVATAGSVWRNPNWIPDPIAPPTPTQFTGGTPVTSANPDYIYNRDVSLGQHAFIELSIDLASLEGDLLSVYWQPSCGNDELSVHTPEPASLAIWSVLGGIGCLLARARRRKP